MPARSAARPRRAAHTIVVAVCISVIGIAAAAAPLDAQGGLLTGWRPEPDQRDALYAGYARHLEWHRSAGDTLAWFGWDVLAGRGQGLFVDGTFGAPFAALDVRVDPQGDVRDHAVNVDAFASPAWREVVLLRRDLSTAALLEERRPTTYVQVVRYTLSGADGMATTTLETALRDVAAGRGVCARGLLPYTVYEAVAGSGAPGFIMMIWRDRLGSFDDDRANPERCVRQLVAASRPSSAGTGVTIEVWRLRRDLSYMGRAQRGEMR